LVITFIFAFTGVYLKYAIVSQQLIVPKLEDLVLRYRSLKMGSISCQQKYLTLIFFCLFAGWGEHHGKQGWRGCVWALKKSGAFRDSAKMGFKLSRNTHEEILTYIRFYVQTKKSARCRKVQDVFVNKE
jgi:hypothetical protein